ncbi:MAG: aldehyde dehydrogenase family protein [Acidobacteriota bacterium]
MAHLPLIRGGRSYRSLEVRTLRDVRDGSPVAQISQASPGMISRDLLQVADHRRVIEGFSTRELVEICQRAAVHFAESDLPLGDDGITQSPDQYAQQLAATTGMPVAMGKANMVKIVHVLENMEAMLGGLTRGLDLDILDAGWGVQGERKLSYLRQAESLGVVLPNNSPGVHTLWLPALPLKTPLVLRPGSSEPWTPYRVIQAFLAAGAPAQAFSFYPSSREAGNTLLSKTDRSMIFGDASTVERWERDLTVQAHGPGWSKVILGPDAADSWEEHLDLMVQSAAANGGRSCINSSGVWTTAHGRTVAEAMAQKLARVQAKGLDDPSAELAAFADPQVARWISDKIDEDLASGGAVDLTALARAEAGLDPSRVATAGGCTFLLPTVIWCESPDHPLARSEYGFPFCSVVEVPKEELLDSLGYTLVGTLISEDEALRRETLSSDHVDRLNLGPIPTYKIAWDQPHEGNLFDHLYKQRAIQAA